MKSTSISYHVLLLFIGGVAIFSLSRINKVSFYHHYFKVIREVEVRNSHYLLRVVNITSRFFHASIRQYLQASGLLQPLRLLTIDHFISVPTYYLPLSANKIRFIRGCSPRAP